MSLSLRRLLTSLLLMAALVSARESALPDVHYDSTSIVQGHDSLALSSTDIPANDAAGHGHGHACHCSHTHIAGLPSEGELLAELPSVAGILVKYIPEFGVSPTAPPHQPPRA